MEISSLCGACGKTINAKEYISDNPFNRVRAYFHLRCAFNRSPPLLLCRGGIVLYEVTPIFHCYFCNSVGQIGWLIQLPETPSSMWVRMACFKCFDLYYKDPSYMASALVHWQV